MTKVVGSKASLEPLAQLLRSHNQLLRNLHTRQTQYTLDDNGNALVIVGDLANAPVAGFTSPIGTMEATGLTGHGIAVYCSPAGTPDPVWVSGGQWLQLPTSTTMAAGGYTEVNVSVNKTLALADANTEQNWTAAGAGTITIPPNSAVNFPLGTFVRFRQTNTGTLTVSPSAPAQLHNNSTVSGSVSLLQQGYALEAVKVATDVWIASWSPTGGSGGPPDETLADYQPVGTATNLAFATGLNADSGHQHGGAASVIAADTSIVVTSSDSAGHGDITLSVPSVALAGAAVVGQFFLQGYGQNVTLPGGAFIVPPGVTTMHVQAQGAAGGYGQAIQPSGQAAAGTATFGTSTSVTDSTKTYTVNAYANFYLVLTGGTGAGQIAQIASNTSTIISINPTTSFSPPPDNTTTYTIAILGAPGSFVQADIPVTPGASYYTTVGVLGGGQGHGGAGSGGGPAGGSGGGATDVRVGGNTTADRVIVAAGGGGTGGGATISNGNGGAGGGLSGTAAAGQPLSGGLTGGQGGSQTAGGSGGTSGAGGNTGAAGTFGAGGNGGAGGTSGTGGSGGGGDGYYGGGGGHGPGGGTGSAGTGGGGGSDFLTGTATNIINHVGFNSGSGTLAISFS